MQVVCPVDHIYVCNSNGRGRKLLVFMNYPYICM